MSLKSKQERDDRLDALQKATVEYAAKTRERLKNQVIFAKRVLKGRPGSDSLNNESVQLAAELVVDEIDAFIVA